MSVSISTEKDAATWTLADADELYRISAWGHGYFGIDPLGRITVRPRKDEGTEVALMEIVEGIEARGLAAPVLLRFSDILDHRLGDIHRAFDRAMTENEYRGRYTAVFPIKVNQQRHVVEEVYRFGAPYGFGLEVGSKPELLAALGVVRDERPILCNGFKDDEYIKSAILARKVGRDVIPIVESAHELELIAKHADRIDVEPRFGVRVKLASSGAGRWSESAGARSKFGLTVSEILDALELLEARGMKHCLKLLHCHMGSQIHDIKKIKDGINELAFVYTELVRMGAGLDTLDVGGGLGVDYDGSRTNFESSMNYSLEEYASDVVYRVMNACDNAGVPHPTLVTECGRAMVAYHSVLVFSALGSGGMRPEKPIPEDLEATLDDEVPQPVFDLLVAYRSAPDGHLVEVYHDALQAREEAMSLFNLGYLSLPLRGLVERLFWAVCERIRGRVADLDSVPEELEELDDDLRETYFCNFSLFQSIPDAWALRQVFPIAPLHRLDEQPRHRGILADITCDSDGKIDLFPHEREVKELLELHEVEPGQSYYLGAFLVGAYQETLGDLHNLFGDTNVVHIDIDDDGGWHITDVIEGDTVAEVLQYVQYDPEDLLDAVRKDCEAAVRQGRMTVSESRSLLRFYRSGLQGYTYLEGEEE
jgi:arginine decarboxylase